MKLHPRTQALIDECDRYVMRNADQLIAEIRGLARELEHLRRFHRDRKTNNRRDLCRELDLMKTLNNARDRTIGE